jgi:hypothetical protein
MIYVWFKMNSIGMWDSKHESSHTHTKELWRHANLYSFSRLICKSLYTQISITTNLFFFFRNFVLLKIWQNLRKITQSYNKTQNFPNFCSRKCFQFFFHWLQLTLFIMSNMFIFFVTKHGFDLWALIEGEMKQLKANIQIYFKLDDFVLTFKLESWNIEKKYYFYYILWFF